MNRESWRYLSVFSAVLCMAATVAAAENANKDTNMSANKLTVQSYMDAFHQTDHEAILACLTDDVEWIVPGFFHTHGKKEFDGQIENDAFVGSPTITIKRLIEEDNIVVAEGNVQSKRKDGGKLNVDFCDVFEFENGKIKRLISYLVQVE